ncbi:hypothetical protein [Desulfosarcina alkanivorans]|nr:hypothetical protein [Desulfosarcina alkanivorans]
MNFFLTAWKNRVLACFLTTSTMIVACASAPDIISNETSADHPYSNAQVRQMTVDQPALLSGDFFRERNQMALHEKEDGSADGERLEKQRTELGGHDAKIERRTAVGKEDSMPTSSTLALAPVKQRMKIKVGVLFDRDRVPAGAAEVLIDAMTTVSMRFHIVPVPPVEIREAIPRHKEPLPKDLVGLSQVVSIYPGVRMLVRVETIQLPKKFPGHGIARIHLIDTAIPHRYPSLEITNQLLTKVDVVHFMDNIVSVAFEQAVYRSAIIPWFCRVFYHENHVWYVNAGKDSGLKKGDRLAVVAKGKLVRAPSGLPAGWILDDTKGALRVDRFFGKDLAVCSLLDGRGPENSDLLVK